MAYSARAEIRRRCVALRKDGKPCEAWATWDDPHQRCAIHAGRHFRGHLPIRRRFRFPAARKRHAKYKPCTCPAYWFPHRPGGGLCEWPDPPRYRLWHRY